MRRSAALFFSILLGITAMAQEKATRRVDLTTQIATAQTESTVPNRSVRRLATTPKLSPATRVEVTMSLGNMDRPAFQWGDAFTYELTLKNRGTSVLQIPYSRDFARLTSASVPDSQLLTATLMLGVLKPESGELIGNLESLELRGSNTVPETIIRLQPGDELMLKVPAQWTASDRIIAAVRANNGAIRVFATLILSEQETFDLTPGLDAFVFAK